MTVQYKIMSALTNGTDLTIIAKCCERMGIRKDEHGNGIPIIGDLPITGKLGYIKKQIEVAYDALPDETLVKSLIGRTWSS